MQASIKTQIGRLTFQRFNHRLEYCPFCKGNTEHGVGTVTIHGDELDARYCPTCKNLTVFIRPA